MAVPASIPNGGGPVRDARIESSEEHGMGKIVITSNVTLDGVVQDPDGEEGFELGGWFHQFVGSKDLEAWVARETKEALGAEALLLGRRSSEWFAYRRLSRG